MSSSAHNLIEKNKLLKEQIWYKKLKLKNLKRKNRRLEEELFQTRFSITTLLRRFKPYPDVCDNINDGYQQVSDYLEQLELNNRELEELSKDKFNQFSTTTSRRRLQQEEHLKQISDDYKPSVQTSQFQRALDESEERFQENTRKLPKKGSKKTPENLTQHMRRIFLIFRKP
ncbi:hypothetical protein QE152_g40462 [Popillia japonica]|uniref:Uncharacterized protein n=1 Tax=Popillia japonica TaxID=7064 RepID=A0AAW1HGA7_POPJA